MLGGCEGVGRRADRFGPHRRPLFRGHLQRVKQQVERDVVPGLAKLLEHGGRSQTRDRPRRAEYGRHHRLGLGFLALLDRPALVRFATAHGLKRPALVAAALRLMGNLTDGRDGDGIDRAVAALTRLAPAV